MSIFYSFKNMFFFNWQLPNVVRVSIIGFADYGVYRYLILVAFLRKSIYGQVRYNCSNGKSICQNYGSLYASEFFYLGVPSQFSMGIENIYCSRDFFLVKVTTVRDDSCYSVLISSPLIKV